jgi:hypothetical protein
VDRDRLVFFYCTRKHGYLSEPAGIIRGIVSQLSWMNEMAIAESVRIVYDRHMKGNTAIPSTLSNEQWSGVSVELISYNKRTTIIMDGLDECDDSDELLLRFKNISDRVNGKLLLLVSSRMHTRVSTYFPSFLEDTICPEESSSDIAEYIRCELQNR